MVEPMMTSLFSTLEMNFNAEWQSTQICKFFFTLHQTGFALAAKILLGG